MKIIWTPSAADDLEYAVHEISADRPDAAARVAARIYNHILMLATMPHMGRMGELPDTRELVFPSMALYRGVSCQRRRRQDSSRPPRCATVASG